MSKKNKKQQRGRSTNWTLIIAIIGLSAIGLIALLFISLSPTETVTIEQRCAATPEACVSFGSPDADVTLIELLDFGCGHCRDFHLNTMPQIEAAYVETGRIQLIYYPYALSNQTELAAVASLCAAEQNGYSQFADELFSQPPEQATFSYAGLMDAAEQAELGLDEMRSCLDSGRNEKILEENMEIARAQRINSTPTFLLNGTPLTGNRPFSFFQTQLDALLGS